MDKLSADMKADNLVSEILKSQPNLLGPMAATADNGEFLAEFIAALHKGLSDSFQKRN